MEKNIFHPIFLSLFSIISVFTSTKHTLSARKSKEKKSSLIIRKLPGIFLNTLILTKPRTSFKASQLSSGLFPLSKVLIPKKKNSTLYWLLGTHSSNQVNEKLFSLYGGLHQQCLMVLHSSNIMSCPI